MNNLLSLLFIPIFIIFLNGIPSLLILICRIGRHVFGWKFAFPSVCQYLLVFVINLFLYSWV